nr:cobyrinate a,c-diamide synthase [uncultured Cohaesibacter sp.]
MNEPLQNSLGLILAASSSNAGKTTLSLGLQRLFLRKGITVAPAKCGPDYIDPAFHAVASGHASINLDPWAMSAPDLRARARQQSALGNLLFVEGVMGLFDGAANGQGSTATLAHALGLPVILVLDVKGQAQTAAAIAKGICDFDPNVTIGGILLNRVGSFAHEHLLREAFAPLDLPIVGAVRGSDSLRLPSRHLGLVQAGEHNALDGMINTIADHMADNVDLDLILKIAKKTECQPDVSSPASCSQNKLPPLGQRIAIARDEAFSFIYPHLLNDWKEQGAELSFFSPLANEAPSSDADAIYLPGGYPELHLEKLSSALTFKQAMHDASKRGILIFGECGGYMTLGRSIISAGGIEAPMLGLLPITTSFAETKLSLGYRKLSHSSALPWPETLAAHEFHYATIKEMGETELLFSAKTAADRDLPSMGQRVGSVHGSFAHIIAPLNNKQ